MHQRISITNSILYNTSIILLMSRSDRRGQLSEKEITLNACIWVDQVQINKLELDAYISLF